MNTHSKPRNNLMIFSGTMPLSTLIRKRFGGQYFDLLGVRYFRNLFIKANKDLFGDYGKNLTFQDLISARVPNEILDKVIMPITIINVPFNCFLDNLEKETPPVSGSMSPEAHLATMEVYSDALMGCNSPGSRINNQDVCLDSVNEHNDGETQQSTN